MEHGYCGTWFLPREHPFDGMWSGGRPKSAPLSHACRELLAAPVPDDPEGRTYAEAIAEKLAQKAALSPAVCAEKDVLPAILVDNFNTPYGELDTANNSSAMLYTYTATSPSARRP
jgi:hypothetical protein